MLDFSLTLVFNHLVLTSYYSSSIPTSLFFYAVLFLGAIFTLVCSEQLAVRREMREGLNVGGNGGTVSERLLGNEERDAEAMEMGSLRRD